MELEKLFNIPLVKKKSNLFELSVDSMFSNQQQTNETFNEKWQKLNYEKNISKIKNFQEDWFLNLYGFSNAKTFKKYLSNKKIILDAGCGLGYKSEWIAKLSPQSLVIGMDYSDVVYENSERFKNISNLKFIRGDIANTGIIENSVDFIYCDQVLMHTEYPEETFSHLKNLLIPLGELACYVYSKKALPRELLDDFFRHKTHNISNDQLWEMSEQLTEIGKKLSELNVSFDCPEVPLLGIKAGNYDIQRFIYWNFIKCFWNPNLGKEVSDSTNFDWYSPSNAKRFSKEEFELLINENNLDIIYFHSEDACYSGRFKK